MSPTASGAGFRLGEDALAARWPAQRNRWDALGCAGMVFGQSQQARRLRRLPLCGLIQLHAELQWEGVAHSRNMLGHDLKQQHQLETMAMV